MRFVVALGLLLALILSAAAPVHARTGANAASHLTLQRLWTQSLAANADSAPAYLAHPSGHRGAIVYTLAGNNSDNCRTGNPLRQATLYALDAASGRILWRRGTTGPSRCTTAGPVVDPSGKYVYAPGLDGELHRYNAVSGAEATGHGWPVRITLMPDVEKMAATPTIHGGYLYATTSGFIGDQGHYEGHLVTIRLSTGTFHVFNSLCSNVRTLLGPTPGRTNYCPYVTSGLFGRGQGVTDPLNGDVYVVSGNGDWNGRTNWGDSIMKLDPSGNRLLDAYTPTNQKALEDSDADLGSTGPALLPPVKVGGRTYHLLVQGGKGPAAGTSGAALRLLNRDNLSGKGGPGHLGGDLSVTSSPGGCEVLTAPIVHRWGNAIWIYYANHCGTVGYRLAGTSLTTFHLVRGWASETGGTTPALAGGMLYVADGPRLTAYNARNGSVLWRGSVGSIHWEYPLVRSGVLYQTNDDGKIMAFRIR